MTRREIKVCPELVCICGYHHKLTGDRWQQIVCKCGKIYKIFEDAEE